MGEAHPVASGDEPLSHVRAKLSASCAARKVEGNTVELGLHSAQLHRGVVLRASRGLCLLARPWGRSYFTTSVVRRLPLGRERPRGVAASGGARKELPRVLA